MPQRHERETAATQTHPGGSSGPASCDIGIKSMCACMLCMPEQGTRGPGRL